MAEALSGNGKGAHAISRQANLETCSILGPGQGEPPSPAGRTAGPGQGPSGVEGALAQGGLRQSPPRELGRALGSGRHHGGGCAGSG
eukprot:6035522-Pyramimonas_sp.AAC.1